ncbi:hypothetical protein [Kutzneria sp. NPDC051319]|uniref:hypothetical protein n=1 Tax=Kutzneria sp. NPDC051319 TaxID=3155047 RepID=UPI0034148F65
MADPNPDSNNPGEGTPDDFTQWDWHKIMTAVVGAYGNNTNSGLSDPNSLYTAANALEYVKNTLQMVAQSIKDQADALSYGDDAPWKGAAAGQFNQMMYSLGQNIHANAQVLTGDVAGDDIPNQVYASGQHLATAINTLHAIDHWYADQAIKMGAHVVDGVVMVHEKQEVVDALNRDMRTVITNLSNNYKVTNDGFTPPSTDNNPGPNGGDDNPFGNGNNNPFGDGNNPFGDGNNPFGDGNNPFGSPDPFNPGGNGPGGNGPGGSDFTPPPLQNFAAGPGDGTGGPGLGDNGPGLSDFPGGDDSGLGGDSGPGLSDFPGGGDSGLGGGSGPGLSDFNSPPLSNFPGSGDSGLGGPGGDSGLGGGSAFSPPPLSNFPGLGNSGLGNSGLDNNLATSGLNNSSDPFADGSGLDTSGLDNPALKDFPGLGGGAGGGVGGGADGLGDAGGLGDLGNNLVSDNPALQGFPGLGDSGLGGANGPGSQGNMGSGMPMMPPGMGGMGGGQGNQNNPVKSDASGLLNPTPFPGDLGGGFDSSGLLTGGPGALSGLGGGLSGLDGLDTGAGGGGGGLGGAADLPSLEGFPGGTDVSDPSLAGLGDGGLSTENLGGGQQQQAGGPGAPGMPMSPGMGGMGGGQGGQNNQPVKSDASGLLNPTAFPGSLDDTIGDPSGLITGGAGAAEGGSGGLSGLDVPQVSAFDGDLGPATAPDGTSVDNPNLPVEEALGPDGLEANPQQLASAGGPAGTPGMPMMPGGGMGGAAAGAGQNNAPTRSDASGLLNPTEFPGGVEDGGSDPSGLITGGTGAVGGGGGLSDLPATDATVVGDGQPPQATASADPMMIPPLPTSAPTGAAPGEHRSEASQLLAPGGTAFSESGFAEHQHGHPGGTQHDAVPAEPMTPPNRVAMVNGQDGAEDFTAWEAGAAGSVAVLPWLFGRGGRNNDGDVQTDAPVEDNDKWVQGDMRGVPAPADQPHLATWRPEKVVTAPGQPAEEVVLRSSAAMPEPMVEPEPEPDADAEDGEEEPERTSADLLDRRSDQWDGRGSDLPGVLG